MQDVDNEEGIGEFQGVNLDSFIVDNLAENSSDHDSGDDEEEDSEESNIEKQCENFK